MFPSCQSHEKKQGWCFMILAQSCIDNIGLLKKAAALFLYFSHFGFSLGLSEGKKTNRQWQWTGRQFREGSRGLEDSVSLLPQRGGRGLDQMSSWWEGSSPSCDFLLRWLRDPSRAFWALGKPWEHMQVREQNYRLGYLGEQVSRPQGYDDGGGRIKHPNTSLLISKYSKGLRVYTITSQMFFKV